MENEENLVNDVMETTEETIIHDSTKLLKTLGIIGGALFVGGLTNEHVIKPMIIPIIQKHKALRLRMAEKNSDENIIDAKEDDSEEE